MPVGTSSIPARPGRALIVDDSPANVRLLERILGGLEGVETHSTTDPRVALELFTTIRPDIVLLDLHMAPLDGVALMAAMRDALPAGGFVPMVVLTADALTTTRDRALAAGATDFLVKPLDAVEVRLRVTNLLATRALYLESEARRHEVESRLAEEEAARRAHKAHIEKVAGRVRTLLSDGGLVPVFQPIVSAETLETTAFEALSRFETPDGLAPAQWFEDAHEVGLGIALERAAAVLALGGLGWFPPEVQLNVNVSPSAIVDDAFVDCLDDVEGRRVILEITEHERVDDYAPLVRGMNRLRERGFSFAVDDTGVGYSGLSHILRLRPEWIKIDLELTTGIDRDPARRALARSIESFATETNARTIAEGVETESELAALRDVGITHLQGYLFGRPEVADHYVRRAEPRALVELEG